MQMTSNGRCLHVALALAAGVGLWLWCGAALAADVRVLKGKWRTPEGEAGRAPGLTAR